MPEYYSLTDYLGRPIEKPSLLQTLARANVMGVRQAVSSGASRGLTPQRLASILREAEDGDPERYMELAEEMEEKDPHYLAVLGTRKRQVSQLDITVEAADKKDANDLANADLVKELIDSDVIDEVLFDMLDAVGKGFSVCEIMWNFSATRWKPKTIEWVDPRFIDWDRETRCRPLLIGNAGERVELTPAKFLFLQIKAKSGIPIRSGIARAIAFNWMCKNFTVKDWIQFLEVYGMPVRIGKYPQGASEDDINALLRAISQIGSDACGVIPQSMLIEFVKSDAQANAGPLFGGAADYFDKQTSKLVLGQTGTTDATPGQLGNGDSHSEVRKDIELADAKALMTCINRQLIRPYIDINRGPQTRYPYLWIGRPESKDPKMMAEVARILVPMGAKIAASDITGAAGFTEPDEDAQLLTVPTQGLGLPFGAGPTLARALAAVQKGDAIDTATAEMLSDWRVTMKPLVAQIEKVIATASSLEDLRAKLADLDPDVGALTDKIASALIQAAAGGLTGDVVK